MSRIIKAAMGYSQLLEWSLFPVHSLQNGRCSCKKDCSSPGKHPIPANGVKSATNDSYTIKKWFNANPNANIGIATGSINGFFVLDVDPRHNGNKSLLGLEKEGRKLPNTVKAITGSNGSHYLFKHHEGIGNRTNLLPGIDIRGDGGYIIVPPSNHISGRCYEWAGSNKPYVTEIAEAPDWLIDMLVKPKEQQSKAKPKTYWLDIMKGVGEGNRNNAAASLAGYLFKRYVEPGLVVEIMALWNERNQPPLRIDELDKIIQSIAGKELTRRKVCS